MTNGFVLNHDKSLHIYFFCLKRRAKYDFLKDVESTVVLFCLFVLVFYGPVNPMGSCRAWSVYLTTCLLGRLSSLSS